MTTEKKPEVKLDEKAILEKVSKGEELTAEETEFAAGNPNADRKPAEAEGDDEAEGAKPEGEEEAGAEAAPSPEDGEEKDDAENDADGDKGDEEPAKPAKGAEAKKSPQDVTKERRALINAELDKPDGEENLAQFSPVEIGLYWDLKKARRKNQKLEQDNRELRFKEVKRAVKEGVKEATGKPEDEDGDPLDGIDDDEVLTGAEVKERLNKAAGKKKPAKPEGEAEDDAEDGGEGKPKPLLTREAVRTQRTQAAAILKGKGVEDFEDVIDFAQYALEGDDEAREELIETAKRGGNVAEKTYWLIKGSKAWPKIEAEIKRLKGGKAPAAGGGKAVPKENLDRAERIQKNEQKVRTTGAPGGGGGAVGEYTEAEILAMSPAEFGRLPVKTQDAILRKYGSEPNLSV